MLGSHMLSCIFTLAKASCQSLCAGAVFIQLIQTQLDKFGDVKFESLSGANARKIVLVIGIMSAHALGEGCGVGVSFCGTRGWAQVTHPTALPASMLAINSPTCNVQLCMPTMQDVETSC